ncbi:hypothetical protein DdX_02833 [Ditylenchus destructor]|uniref:Uncharacterized protein n=1 Tax=Ditylenchus destructor TaxID=166010 RepID=A0AAD4R6D8_9BILA|nr:hypothetical protein DdX_02833 [Ditylenchus destructor]
MAISLYSNLLARAVFLKSKSAGLRDLSGAILLYMGYHVVMSLTGVPFNIYELVEFVTDLGNPNHEPVREVGEPLFFWLGMWINNYVFLGPIPM